MRRPLNTRPGNEHEPIEPGAQVVLVVAVARALAVEVVTLHATSKTLASTHRSDVDLLACCKRFDGDFVSEFQNRRLNQDEVRQVDGPARRLPSRSVRLLPCSTCSRSLSRM